MDKNEAHTYIALMVGQGDLGDFVKLCLSPEERLKYELWPTKTSSNDRTAFHKECMEQLAEIIAARRQRG